MLSSIYIYTISWFAIALIWIAWARIRLKFIIIRGLSCWELNGAIIRLLEGDPKGISGFEDNIHVRLVVTLALISSNILVLCISMDGFGIDDAIRRSGQLIIVNLLPVSLLCHRHSFLGWMTDTCKPEFLWVHYSFGWLALAEVLLHFALWVTPSSSGAVILHWPAFAAAAAAALIGCLCLPWFLKRPWPSKFCGLPWFLNRLWPSERCSIPFLAWRYSHLTLAMAFIVFSTIHIQQSTSMLGCALIVISITVISSTMDFRTNLKSSCTLETTEGNLEKIKATVHGRIAGEYYFELQGIYYKPFWYEEPDRVAPILVTIGQKAEMSTWAVLDPAAELCYISQSRASKSGFVLGGYNNSFETTIGIRGNERPSLHYNINFNVLSDKDPKFIFWETDIILGENFHPKINFIELKLEHIQSTLEQLQKPIRERKTSAILILKSQVSKSQLHGIRGPFARSSSHHVADEDSIVIMTSDRGISEAFALFQSRVVIKEKTKLMWFSDDVDLVSLYLQRYNRHVDKNFRIYLPPGAYLDEINKYVTLASKEKALYNYQRPDLKVVVFGESFKVDVKRYLYVRKGLPTRTY